MTTLATILGILPIALAIGAGSEGRMSMGIAVIGGLVCGGALTLYVIPAMYVLFEGRAKFRRSSRAPLRARRRRGRSRAAACDASLPFRAPWRCGSAAAR